MNSKDKVLNFLNESILDLKDNQEDYSVYTYNTTYEAYLIALDYFAKHFDELLKQYNNDEERAYDNYTLNEILEDYSKFASIDYKLIADRYNDDIAWGKSVRKQLNSIHNILCHEFK